MAASQSCRCAWLKSSFRATKSCRSTQRHRNRFLKPHDTYLGPLVFWLDFPFKAALFALQSLCKEKFNSHIQLQSDNSTTVACINNKGSAKPACNEIARDIWLWCLERHNFLQETNLRRKCLSECRTLPKLRYSLIDDFLFYRVCKLVQMLQSLKSHVISHSSQNCGR